ncbi:MAG: TolB family protein [Chloroflexi bacterium]|nr:TolB family protein [Chloroflexota bacterium]
MVKRLLLLLLVFLLTACQGSSVAMLAPTPTTEPPTATLAPTDNTPKPTATPEPTEILTPTATSTPVERLVYPEGLSAVFVNSDGSNKEKLELLSPDSVPADTAVQNLQPSPDGRYLAFGAVTGFYQPGTYYSAMHIMDLQTKSAIAATKNGEWNELGGGASWSPDSRKMVFFSNAIWDNDIGQLEYLTSYGDTRKHPLYPVWSPSGEYIAFACFESEFSFPMSSLGESHGELCLIRPDDTEVQTLVEHIYLPDSRPPNAFSWSPDGRWIAYLAGDTMPDIAIVNIETRETRILASSPAKDTNPDWSPDGTRIAFASNRNGKDEVFVVGLDGRNLTSLTPNSEFDNFNPVWSPSGNHIAFTSFDPGTSVHMLTTITTDGTVSTQIGFSGARPVWTSGK